MVVLFIHKHKRGIPYKIINPEYVKKLESQASLIISKEVCSTMVQKQEYN